MICAMVDPGGGLLPPPPRLPLLDLRLPCSLCYLGTCLITRSTCAGASSATGISLSGKGVVATFAVFNENKGYP